MSASPGPQPDAAAPPPRKPRFALFVATACGLGYAPIAPGTFGSLAGLLVAMLPFNVYLSLLTDLHINAVSISAAGHFIDPVLALQCVLGLAVGTIGVWSSLRAAQFWGQKDPQRVVIDEVSGQHLTLMLGCAVPIWWRPEPAEWASPFFGLITLDTALSWKYLLVGFILFRLFDIWKPFPARQAESLPGGWGIMADDWIAAVYAGIGLWIARAMGL